MGDIEKLRAWWAHKQGLDGSPRGRSPAEVLAKTGWARSLGGAGPYLTLFARAGTSREAADASVSATEIYELPSARGCAHVLPAADFALGLRVGQGFSDEAELRTAAKLGVTESEIAKLTERVLEALSGEVLDPEEIRVACGDAVRSLGDEGKKKGITTTLPPVLGKLQQTGQIHRVPVNGRLDQQRYKYTAWGANPLIGYELSKEEAYVELARRYFSWVGPATIAEFQWFSALSAKGARAALAPLGLMPLPGDEGRMLLPEDVEAFAAFRVPEEPDYVLVSAIDGISLLRRSLRDLVEPDALAEIDRGMLMDLPSHGIFDRGRLIGLREYDRPAGEVVWMTFDRKRGKALEAAVASTEAFVRDQLGDARAMSLDTPKSRAPRVAAIRAAGRP